MDRGASQATIYGVAKSWTQLSKWTHTTQAMSHSLSPGFYKINFFSSQTKFSQTKLSSSWKYAFIPQHNDRLEFFHFCDRQQLKLYLEVEFHKNICFMDTLKCRVVQYLRCHAPSVEGQGSIPGHGTRFHKPQLKILHATTETWCSQIFFN